MMHIMMWNSDWDYYSAETAVDLYTSADKHFINTKKGLMNKGLSAILSNVTWLNEIVQII